MKFSEYLIVKKCLSRGTVLGLCSKLIYLKSMDVNDDNVDIIIEERIKSHKSSTRSCLRYQYKRAYNEYKEYLGVINGTS